jgi:hypothetical protein
MGPVFESSGDGSLPTLDLTPCHNYGVSHSFCIRPRTTDEPVIFFCMIKFPVDTAADDVIDDRDPSCERFQKLALMRA